MNMIEPNAFECSPLSAAGYDAQSFNGIDRCGGERPVKELTGMSCPALGLSAEWCRMAMAHKPMAMYPTVPVI